MATWNITTDSTLHLIDGSHTNDDIINIRDGATLTVTQSPSARYDRIDVQNGTLHIDGTNISSGNCINWVGGWGGELDTDGRGTILVTGDWFSLGTTSGSAGQTFDLSSTGLDYWDGDVFVDIIPMVEVETGRRIDYDGGSGTLPEVDDFVFDDSDYNVFGQIVEVSGTVTSGYIVVRWLTGSLADNDTICVRKVVDDVGPDFQKSWTASVNNASGDIKESGVYQQFGNAGYSTSTDYMSEFSSDAGGFVFTHNYQTTTLKMATALGGFVPPSGCNVRVPNVHFSSADATSWASNQTRWGTTSVVASFNLLTTAGDIDFEICNLGTVAFYPGGAKSFRSSHVGSANSWGGSAVGSRVEMEFTCINSLTLFNGQGAGSFVNVAQDLVFGGDFNNCMFVSKGPNLKFGALTSSDVTFNNCLITSITGNDASSIRTAFVLSSCAGVSEINNLIIYQQGDSTRVDEAIRIQSTTNVTMRRPLLSGSQDRNTQGLTTVSLVSVITSTDCYIEGLEILHGSFNMGAIIGVVDGGNHKVRACGMISEKIGNGVTTALDYFIDVSGVCNGLHIARCWKDDGVIDEFIEADSICQNITVENCSGSYNGDLAMNAANFLCKGLHAAGGSINGSSGVEGDIAQIYGTGFYDIFRSDTAGAIGIVFIEKSASMQQYTINAGTPAFGGNNYLYMESGDQITWEMPYFALGHTGFHSTSMFTASDDNTAHADGYDDVTGNVGIEVQYDVGSGYNGTWLDLTNSTDQATLRSLPDFSAGIKLKVRFTANATKSIRAFMIHTDTTLAAQTANLYPIDQVTLNLKFEVQDDTGSPVSGALVYIDDNDTSPFMFQSTTDVNGEATYSYTGGAIAGTKWKVRKYGYRPYKATVNIGSSDITLPVTLVTDPQQV